MDAGANELLNSIFVSMEAILHDHEKRILALEGKEAPAWLTAISEEGEEQDRGDGVTQLEFDFDFPPDRLGIDGDLGGDTA